MRPLPLAITFLAACNLSDPVGVDSGSALDADTDAEGEGDAETQEDAEVDDGGAREPGPLTFIMNDRFLTVDWHCDLDGDGDLDNSLADLGGPAAGLFATAVSAIMQANLEASQDPERQLIHFPWIDDPNGLHDASANIILAKVQDRDDPADVTDDFDGDERYFARGTSLDACGEPLHYATDVQLEGGHFAGEISAFPVDLGDASFELGNVYADWTIEETGGGLSLSFFVCGGATASSLAETLPEIPRAPGLSALEIMLGGGAIFGMPTVPGLEPDLDLDGDGLERFETDADGQVERCIDGDLTIIEGRDCAKDDRMADGFSLTPAATAVPAIFAGLWPEWESEVVVPCDAPPETSLWDPR